MRHLWHNCLEARANGRAKNSEMIHVTLGANPYVTFTPNIPYGVQLTYNEFERLEEYPFH